MALIVEDGSLVPSANSFVSYDEFVSFLTVRNLTLPADQAAGEVELIVAADYLNELCYRGRVVAEDQAMCFPRYLTYDKNDFIVSSSVIHQDIKLAQIEVSLKMREGFDPSTQSETGDIKSETVDVLSITYKEGSRSSTPSIRNIGRAYRLLKPFLNNGGSGYGGGIDRA